MESTETSPFVTIEAFFPKTPGQPLETGNKHPISMKPYRRAVKTFRVEDLAILPNEFFIGSFFNPKRGLALVNTNIKEDNAPFFIEYTAAKFEELVCLINKRGTKTPVVL